MPSIFANLFKYRASESRSPREDFFTEALAGVLNTSLPLRIAFVRWLIVPKRLIGHEVESVRIETQMTFKTNRRRGRFDMWLEAKDDADGKHLIVLENKIDASLSAGQLEKYECYLGKEQHSASSRTLVYFSPYSPSKFQPSNDEVEFLDRRWFDVYDWLRKWTQQHHRSTDCHPAPLVDELLALMKDWNMDMDLSATDLETASRYKLVAQPRLLKILDWVHGRVRSKFRTKGRGSGSMWVFEKNELYYASPYLKERNIYFAFGFDFKRDDDAWRVPRLQFPSAYFAVRVDDASHVDWSGLLKDWDPPPDPDYLNLERSRRSEDRVKRLNLIEADGESQLSIYVGFFLEALDEVEKALGEVQKTMEG